MFSWMMCGPRHLVDVRLNPIFSLCFQIKENDKVVLETILSIFNPMLEALPEQDDSHRCCFILKPISCWCHTPASLTHSSSSDSLQGGRQLGCEAIIGLQRSAEKDNIVHCHFLYLSLGKFLTHARCNHGWKCFTDWIARTTHWSPVGMPMLTCRLRSCCTWVICTNCNLWASRLTEVARRGFASSEECGVMGCASMACDDSSRTWLLLHSGVWWKNLLLN